MRRFAVCCLLLVGTVPSQWADAQYESGWKAHEWDRPAPPLVEPGDGCLPLPPPSDAVVLFDGSNLDAWRSGDGGESNWVIEDNVMESVPNSGYIFTKQEFGDCQLHIEWAAPATVKGDSQGRGNSGVFLMGLYEVQVLDSFNNRTYADGSAGSIYGQYPPLVNASRQPGEWQSYDIIFNRPRFDSKKRLVSPARITVLQNGVLVQNGSEPFGPTAWLVRDPYEPTPEKLPLSLQDHGNPVRYRNIWIRHLDENPRPKPEKPYPTEFAKLSDDQLDELVGKYGGVKISRTDDGLQLSMGGRKLEMLPLSADEFVLRYTSGTVKFDRDADGKPTKLMYEFGGGKAGGERE